MNILWFLEKEFDTALNVPARLATIKCLEKKYNVTVVTTFRKEKKYFHDLKSQLIYLDRANLPIIKTISFYYNQIRFLNKEKDLNKFNVVLVNSYNLFLLKKLIKIKNTHDFKSILDVRSLPVEWSYLKTRIINFLLKKNLENASVHFDGITYITDEMRRYCIKKYNLPKHKSAVWSSGVDLGLFKPQNLKNNNKFRILYHGVIGRNRGIQNVVKALSLLREHEIEFLLLGAGIGISELTNLVSKLKLENKVNFKAPVPYEEVPKYINSADVGILPLPEWEGWNTSSPIKLFEYLACGKPVILTKIPAHTNILKGKDFVFWAETPNPESIAKAIMQALKNRIHFMNLGKQARNFAKMNFSWEKQLSKLKRFIRDIQ